MDEEKQKEQIEQRKRESAIIKAIMNNTIDIKYEDEKDEQVI